MIRISQKPDETYSADSVGFDDLTNLTEKQLKNLAAAIYIEQVSRKTAKMVALWGNSKREADLLSLGDRQLKQTPVGGNR